MAPEHFAQPAAFESSAIELTFIFGPPLVLGLGVAVVDWRRLGICGHRAACGHSGLRHADSFACVASAAGHRSVPRWVAPISGDAHLGSRLACGWGRFRSGRGLRSLRPRELLTPPRRRAPLLAVWGIGSLLGGIVAARCGGGARTTRGLTFLLVAFTAGHLALPQPLTACSPWVWFSSRPGRPSHPPMPPSTPWSTRLLPAEP